MGEIFKFNVLARARSESLTCRQRRQWCWSATTTACRHNTIYAKRHGRTQSIHWMHYVFARGARNGEIVFIYIYIWMRSNPSQRAFVWSEMGSRSAIHNIRWCVWKCILNVFHSHSQMHFFNWIPLNVRPQIYSAEHHYEQTVDGLTVSRVSLRLHLQSSHFGNGNGGGGGGGASAAEIPTLLDPATASAAMAASYQQSTSSSHHASGLLLRCTAQVAELYLESSEVELGVRHRDPVPARGNVLIIYTRARQMHTILHNSWQPRATNVFPNPPSRSFPHVPACVSHVARNSVHAIHPKRHDQHRQLCEVKISI